jgi:hypothetical protein
VNERLTRLPQWRGFPIPFFVTYRTDGTPDFKVVDESKRIRCASEKLCWVCGEALGYRFVFLGGPNAAAARTYMDGPMHEECARDALRICPFLVGTMDYASDPDSSRHDLTVQTMPVDQNAPEDMVIYKTRGFRTKGQLGTGNWVFIAAPATSLERVPRGKHK